ncbi:hypothetical protein RIF29_21386 [Crotalaria pallida]|uniref:Rad60/SUMO-like domain-containing protein n=1 Tax=Crotalaria pallida TaxID=3830 RepID=A0AAN9F7C0_CROPI
MPALDIFSDDEPWFSDKFDFEESVVDDEQLFYEEFYEDQGDDEQLLNEDYEYDEQLFYEDEEQLFNEDYEYDEQLFYEDYGDESYVMENASAEEEEQLFPEDDEPNSEECLTATQVNMVCLSIRSGEKPITLIVQRQNEEVLYYRMGMNTRLMFLMMDYCERKGLVFGAMRFIGPDGCRLNGKQTPRDLHMEDVDVIDVFC